MNVWGPADQENQQKIKYAKWNAARIVKAIKEGKDPNESNPTHEERPQLQLDANDPAVQNLNSGPSSPIHRRATVEEVPDVDLRRDAAGMSPHQSPISGSPSPASEGGLRLPGVPTDLHQPAQPGYFDSTSHNLSNAGATPDLPGAPTGWAPPRRSSETSPPPTTWSQPPINPPSASAWPPQQPSAASTNPPTFATNLPSTAAVASPPIGPPTDSYYMNMAPTAHTARPTAPPMPPAASYAPTQDASMTVDEAAIVGAQKHAKWAISALNFEDVPTAINELRQALHLLGAT